MVDSAFIHSFIQIHSKILFKPLLCRSGSVLFAGETAQRQMRCPLGAGRMSMDGNEAGTVRYFGVIRQEPAQCMARGVL